MPNYQKQFTLHRQLAERAMAQLSWEELTHDDRRGTNSIAVIVKHLAGNMRSRWTDYKTTDGEKSWRNRESEFTDDFPDRAAMETAWSDGWAMLENVLADLTPDQLGDIIYIRNEGHTVVDALNRQLAHYSYHVGQIVLLAKQFRGDNWESLSIARGGSEAFNAVKFSKPSSPDAP